MPLAVPRGSFVVLTVHWKNGLRITEPDDEVTAFARREAASLPLQPSFHLLACHESPCPGTIRRSLYSTVLAWCPVRNV
jgi:hypothetical protein